MQTQEYVISVINSIAAELQAMPVMDEAGSPAAVAQHNEWLAKFESINRRVRDAESIALMAIPDAVQEALNQVRARAGVVQRLRTM